MSKEINLRKGQILAIDYIKSGKNVLAVLPTGYGKTIIGINAVKISKDNNQLSFFCTPLKSLSIQMKEDLEKEGFITCLDYGDERQKDISVYNNADVIVTTYERLDSVLRSYNKRKLITKRIGYLIIDEIHNLGSKSRGQSVFSLIEKMIYHFNPKILGLSATVGEESRRYISKLIRGEIAYIPNSERPIPLEKKFIDIGYYNKKIEEVQAKVKNLIRIISSGNRINSLLDSVIEEEYLIVDEKTNITSEKKRYLILFSSRKLAEKVSEILRKSGISADFHHAKRDAVSRKNVEDRFKAGKIQALCCTTTLSQGLNLPCDEAIVFDYKFYNRLLSDFIFMERMDLDQFIGRAGRPGMTKQNKAIAHFLCNSNDILTLRNIMDDDIKVFPDIDFESLINEWVVSELYTDSSSMLSDLVMKYKFDQSKSIEAMKFLVDKSFLINDNFDLSTTNESRIAAWFFVHPRVILALKTLEYKEKELDILNEFINLLPEIDDIIRYDENDDSKLNAYVRNTIGDKYSSEINKIIYYLFYKSFKVDEDDKEVVYLESFSLSSILDRYFVVGNIIIKDEQITRKLKNLSLMIKMKKVLNRDELLIASLPLIGEKRFENLMNDKVKSIADFLSRSSDNLSKLLGLRSEKIEEIKKECRKIVVNKSGGIK